MGLGLGASLSKTGLATPGIVTDSLVMKHNYAAGSVVPVSDGAAYFDQAGTDKISTITPSSTFHADFSVCLWLNRYEVGSEDYIIDSKAGANDGFEVWITTSNTVKFSVDATDVTTSDTLSANRWYHIAVVQDDANNDQQVYIDVVLSQSGSGIVDLDNSNNTLRIARDLSDNNPFKGYMCNLGIWNKALDIDEVKSIMWKQYEGLTSTEATSLVSWYPLEANANDSVGSYNGTTGGF